MILRPYQVEAKAALNNFFRTRKENPCIVLPTGSGKSVVMASQILDWKEETPHVRGCILAHRQELVVQNAEKLQIYFDQVGLQEKIGLFCAGLGVKDYNASITFASIDSIFRRSGDFASFDFIFADESHRIPPAGEGKYRTFIKGCKRFNPNLRVAGWTATPFRMNCGAICHKDHILNEICYEARITDLINQGYLCQLRSKVGEAEYDMSGVKRPLNSDYIKKSLDAVTNTDKIVRDAIREAVVILNREERRSILFFCLSINHCQRVSAELLRNGIYAPTVTSKTDPVTRARILSGLRDGKIRAICNVGVLTEGFDAPCIDAIVLLRPTLSAGLFAQMVGRGLRPHDNKKDCLILDFAGCIDEHGPIDLIGIGNQYTAMAVCDRCRESFSHAVRVCPACGWEIPKQEIERIEEVEKEKRMHGQKASKRAILSDEPETFTVDSVKANRHKKVGKPDSIRIQFRCGIATFSYWLCLDHEGEAGIIAAQWLKRFLAEDGHNINSILDLLLDQKIKEAIKTVTIRRNGKFNEIIAWNQPCE